jgi:hypothetical protein
MRMQVLRANLAPLSTTPNLNERWGFDDRWEMAHVLTFNFSLRTF